MGQLFGRWTIIQRLACDVGLRVAKEYEEATWRSTVQNIRAGVGACGDRLARLDRDILAECKRRVESEAEAHHGEPSKAALAGGEQRASAPWTELQQWPGSYTARGSGCRSGLGQKPLCAKRPRVGLASQRLAQRGPRGLASFRTELCEARGQW